MSKRNFARGTHDLAIMLTVATSLALGVTARADTFVVNVGGSQPPVFNPATIAVNVGDTVAFVNKGGFHNVVADDNSFRCALGCDGDGQGGNGNVSSLNWVASITVAHVGTIGYFCEAHGQPGQGMFGTITVAAPAPRPVAPVPAGGWALATLLAALLALIAGARSVHRADR